MAVGFYVVTFFVRMLCEYYKKLANIDKTGYNAVEGGMRVKGLNKLSEPFQCDEVRPYYEQLKKKGAALVLKRVFDIVVSLIMLVFLILPILVIAIIVKCTSKGHVFFRQERVTVYGKHFRIFKFRTMVENAESLGTQVTTDSDSRVTPIGRFLRKYRLDELPQVFNVLGGSMSFVGTRPEVPRYVEQYRPEYYATLLLPAGITSLASIMYKDEEKLLSSAEDADRVYVEQVLPEKMKYNLEYTKNFSFFGDIKLMLKTAWEVVSK